MGRDGSLTRTRKIRPELVPFVAGMGIKNQAKVGMGLVRSKWVWVLAGYNHTHTQNPPHTRTRHVFKKILGKLQFVE